MVRGSHKAQGRRTSGLPGGRTALHIQGTKSGWQREGRKQCQVMNRIESAAVQSAPLAKSTLSGDGKQH